MGLSEDQRRVVRRAAEEVRRSPGLESRARESLVQGLQRLLSAIDDGELRGQARRLLQSALDARLAGKHPALNRKLKQLVHEIEPTEVEPGDDPAARSTQPALPGAPSVFEPVPLRVDEPAIDGGTAGDANDARELMRAIEGLRAEMRSRLERIEDLLRPAVSARGSRPPPPARFPFSSMGTGLEVAEVVEPELEPEVEFEPDGPDLVTAFEPPPAPLPPEPEPDPEPQPAPAREPEDEDDVVPTPEPHRYHDLVWQFASGSTHQETLSMQRPPDLRAQWRPRAMSTERPRSQGLQVAFSATGWRSGGMTPAIATNLGRTLGDALPESTRQELASAPGDRPMRIQIVADTVTAGDMPWELGLAPDGKPIALRDDVRLVRQVPVRYPVPALAVDARACCWSSAMPRTSDRSTSAASLRRCSRRSTRRASPAPCVTNPPAAA